MSLTNIVPTLGRSSLSFLPLLSYRSSSFLISRSFSSIRRRRRFIFNSQQRFLKTRNYPTILRRYASQEIPHENKKKLSGGVKGILFLGALAIPIFYIYNGTIGKLTGWIDEGKKRAGEIIQKGRELKDTGKEKLEKVVEVGKEKMEKGKEKMGELKEKGKEKIEKGKENIEKGKEKLQAWREGKEKETPPQKE